MVSSNKKFALMHKGGCGKPALFYEGPKKPESHQRVVDVLPGCTWPDGTPVKECARAMCPECKKPFAMVAANFEEVLP